MFVQGQIKISTSKEQIWKIVTDMENAAKIFKDVKSIEILEKPQSGLRGLKWKETRELMGKASTETMWIVDDAENKFYTAEAKNSGCLYHSSIILEEIEGGVVVKKTFRSTPQTIFAKLMTPLMYMMKGTLRKCLLRDLEDLKSNF